MADEGVVLSTGAVHLIVNRPDEYMRIFTQPVVQVLQTKPLLVETPGGRRPHRIVISDGVHIAQCLLMTDVVLRAVAEGTLQTRSILRIKSVQSSLIKSKRVTILLDVDILLEFGLPPKIGNPSPVIVLSGDLVPLSSVPERSALRRDRQQFLSDVTMPTLVYRNGVPTLIQNTNIYPIEALTPYSGTWTIRVTVTHKSDIQSWRKPSGKGKLFRINIIDESGEMKATAFNEQCDLLYDIFEEGFVYYISSPCRVNLAKKQFTHLPNDYELIFERGTIIAKAGEEDHVPKVRFNFSTLADLRHIEKHSTVDVIGILQDLDQTSKISSEGANRVYDKRQLTIVDDTGYSTTLCIWGKTAISFNIPRTSVIAVKGAKVTDFGGRSLSLMSSGCLFRDPDIEDAHRLRGWYDAYGGRLSLDSLPEAHAVDSVLSPSPITTINHLCRKEVGSSAV